MAGFGGLFFSHDAQVLVIQPIERMVGIIEQLKNNPLAQSMVKRIKPQLFRLGLVLPLTIILVQRSMTPFFVLFVMLIYGNEFCTPPLARGTAQGGNGDSLMGMLQRSPTTQSVGPDGQAIEDTSQAETGVLEKTLEKLSGLG